MQKAGIQMPSVQLRVSRHALHHYKVCLWPMNVGACTHTFAPALHCTALHDQVMNKRNSESSMKLKQCISSKAVAC